MKTAILMATLMLSACGGEMAAMAPGGDGGAGGDDVSGTGGAGGEAGSVGSAGTGGAGGGAGHATESDDPAVASQVSGTRIVERLGHTSDGATVFLGWRDISLGIDCTVKDASDGKIRCLPAFGNAQFGGGFYTDAECLQPVTGNVSELGVGAYLHVLGGTGPDIIERITLRHTVQIYQGDPTACVPVADNVIQPVDLSEPVSITVFAEIIPD